MCYNLTEVADILGKSINSVRHIIKEQNIDITNGVDDEVVDKLRLHYMKIDTDYLRRGVKETCPDGFILTSQDVHEISGAHQTDVGRMCRTGILSGALVNTRNGASWFVNEESLLRYMEMNHIPKRRWHDDVIAKARFDRYKEHLFSNPQLKDLASRLNCSKEEAINIAIEAKLKEIQNG